MFSIFKKLQHLVWKFFSEPSSLPTAKKKNTERIYSRDIKKLSFRKRKELEMMCEALFKRKDLITTGRLQCLGLAKVQKKLGKRWKNLQDIVFETVEEVLDLYLSSKDIFIRYKDDTYVLIYADTSPEEAQLKSTIISKEIKNRLFDHEEDAFKNIEIETKTREHRSRVLSEQGATNAIELIARDSGVYQQTAYSQDIEIKPTFEIDPFEEQTDGAVCDLSIHEEKITPPQHTFMPIWDVKQNLLTTYLCLYQEGTESEPFSAHQSEYDKTTTTWRKKLDMAMLDIVAETADAMFSGASRLRIVCPVHYETLMHNKSHEHFILKCQKIPQEHKEYIVFLVWGVPEKIFDLNIDKFFGSIRRHCQALYAQFSFTSKPAPQLLRSLHFDAVGLMLGQEELSESEIIEKLSHFNEFAESAHVKKTFLMGVTSLSITTSAICSNYDLLAGPAVHDNVPAPDKIYKFMYHDLFSGMLSNNDTLI